MLPLTNPLPLVLAIATTFGVLMHDTQVDHATTVAIVNPVSATNYAASEVTSRLNEHVHVERMSVLNELGAHRSTNPRTQTRDDDHHYIQPKRLTSNGGDGVSLWPSV